MQWTVCHGEEILGFDLDCGGGHNVEDVLVVRIRD